MLRMSAADAAIVTRIQDQSALSSEGQILTRWTRVERVKGKADVVVGVQAAFRGSPEMDVHNPNVSSVSP